MLLLEKVVRTMEHLLSCSLPQISKQSYFFHSFSEHELQTQICLVITLRCREKLDPSLIIWLDVGVQNWNELLCISVDLVY